MKDLKVLVGIVCIVKKMPWSVDFAYRKIHVIDGKQMIKHDSDYWEVWEDTDGNYWANWDFMDQIEQCL